MKPAVFEVTLRQETNGLDAMVQVVSLTASSAKRLAVETFFKNGNWTVTGCKVVRDWNSQVKHTI